MGFEEGNTPWNKGIPCSTETRRKIRETKSKQIVWNKGLTKQTDERVRKGAEAKIGRKVAVETRERIHEASLNKKDKLYKNREWLEHQYFKKGKLRNCTGGYEIAREAGCKASTIMRWLRYFNVSVRNKSEAQIGHPGYFKGKHHTLEVRLKMSEGMKGERSPFWKDGRAPLTYRIRNSFKYRQWRSDVYTRDDFTCQKCGRRGCYLEAHHAPLAFADVLELNDVRTYEQAMDCAELWNINNGTAYCRKCHDLTKRKSKDGV